ncbi:MAG: porin [Proteobacteria bacterium]|nr:porin [Pseudomonadota bacterium]
MRKTVFSLFILTTIFLFPPFLQADEVADLKKEVEKLKSRLEIVEAGQDEIGYQSSDLVSVSGYADVEYVIDDRSGVSDGFRTHHFSLLFQKKVSEKWRFFSELEFEYAPKIGEEEKQTITDSGGNTHDVVVTKNKEGRIYIEVLTIDYNYNPYLNLRAGRYLTPAGIWNVEHYTPFVATQEKPQHIQNIFPKHMDGVQLFGTVTKNDVVTDYIAYMSNGSGNTGHGDENDDKSLGGRLRFKFPLLLRTELGLSTYREKDNADTELKAHGVDLNLHWKTFKLQAEYAKGTYDPVSGTDYDRVGYYGQLTYGMGKLETIYRYDWYDANDTVVQGDKSINTVALHYHFNRSVCGKIEHHMIDNEGPATEDYDKTIATIALYFGE